MNELQVIDDADRISAVLPPLRRRVLEALDEPDSASGIAKKLDLPRQKVNYHLRELERAGFVELVEERQKRGCTERVLRATAKSYLVSPVVLGELSEGDAIQDRFSSAYLIVGAARLMRDVAILRSRAMDVGKRLATFTVDVDVSFASPAELKSFTEELAATVGELAARYDKPDDERARQYHLMLGGHPKITKSEEAHRKELDR